MPAKMSVATIDKPEFINIKPCNPLISECEIKVLYVGENRNKSYISKEIATEMANSLPGNPIVGYFREDVGDFRDHGDMVTIDNEGVHFKCMTRPYGFVSPDARVWFQTFEDTNGFGETIVREYLMTTGYLWTGQFKECESAIEGEGKPHSMELDEETLSGQWERNSKGMDFFIINDAIFSKLCILGEDVEPCFEGSSVKAPDVSASFTKVDDTFKHTLFSMMQDLQTALKGGQQMENNTPVVEPVADPVADPIDAFAASQEPMADPTEPVDPVDPVQVDPVEPVADPVDPVEPSVVSDPVPTPEGEPSVDPEPVAEPVVDPEPVVEPIEPAEPTIEERFTALQQEFDELRDTYEALVATHAALQENYTALETANAGLVEFKRQIDDAKKDEMIEKFYMLTDEDKQDVIANKATYSVEDIEEKLSVICFRKKVIFDSENTSKNNNNTEPPVVFNYGNVGTSEPAWITAVKNTKKNRI